MKQTAVIIAPGRGTYNKGELGYLARHHGAADFRRPFDDYRTQLGQQSLSALDEADRFSPGVHGRGDNASALIYACGIGDFLALDRDRFDILAVTGNSMGWYTALACAGALSDLAGLEVANTMGRLMQDSMVGGQMIYPLCDENWREVPGRRAEILGKINTINRQKDRFLALSIDLGGMLVVAGNEAGLDAFEKAVPKLEGRFPMRLANHAGFHTRLQEPVSAKGFDALSSALFQDPKLPLIDGRGAIWHPRSSDLEQLRRYTLGHQVTESYDFAAALRTAAREFMPDVFILLGPGASLGGAVAQSLIKAGWRGLSAKEDFQAEPIRLLSMGLDAHRALCVT